jgi:NADH-quinone oxidoreductase subunit E
MPPISERVREAARAAGEAARAAAAEPADEPVPSRLMGEPVPTADDPVGARPAGLAGPREGGPDDLKKIKGVGPKLEELLHSLGFYHFDQVAGWTEAELAWVDSNLEGFNGRASRDDWVGQARTLATGGETEFSQRVDRGEVY